MGDVSVIARRLGNGQVQYGWSGNGGTFPYLGHRLLYWYDSPEMVGYLFSLGQLRHLYEPHSEGKNCFARTIPTGEPHWLGTTEREIFSQLAFVDVGYFYDTDDQWYYVVPGPFRIKIPLMLVYNSVDLESPDGFPEAELMEDIDKQIIRRIMAYYEEDEEFRAYLKFMNFSRQDFKGDMEGILNGEWRMRPGESYVHMLWSHHRDVFNYFDDWVLIQANEDNTEIQDILLRKKERTHIETIEWEKE